MSVYEKGLAVELLAKPLHDGRRLALLAGAITFAMLVVLAIAAKAHASETIYWDNFRDAPVTIGNANIDGSGGGLLNLGGLEFKDSEGMAYDPVTNRLYIAGEGTSNEGEIVYVNLDGSGAGVFSAPGAEAARPQGIALDPSTRMIYWINTKNETISWAKLDGSAGGTLNTSGAATEGIGYRLAIDPASGRLYFAAEQGGEQVLSYVNVNGTGGGVVLASVDTLGEINGLATDPVNGRLYLLASPSGSEGVLASVNLGGGTVETVSLGSAFKAGYGLAIDPVLQKAYWGNYGQVSTQSEALGYATLSGAPDTISPASAHANGSQDPVILKSPTGTGAPQVTQSVTALTCSQGSWSADYPGGNVFSAPVSYSYQWLLNGAATAGATASTYTATAAGSYSCTVTGKNVTGSASQTSGAVTVTPAALSLALTTKKAHAKAGKAATVKFKVANGGDLSSAPVKVCAKLTKKAKKGLKAPKCASVKALGNAKSAVATLRVKTKKSAKGTYKFTTQVKGAKVKSVTVSVKVIAAKKHHKKK